MCSHHLNWMENDEETKRALSAWIIKIVKDSRRREKNEENAKGR